MKTLDLKDVPWTDIIFENTYYYVFYDGYPVNTGHKLFVPKNDTARYVAVCLEAAYADGQSLVDAGKCDGYNVGMNCGEAAGQTVMYPHIHMIPRIDGDMGDPRGGVRHVIPSKGNYKKPGAYS